MLIRVEGVKKMTKIKKASSRIRRSPIGDMIGLIVFTVLIFWFALPVVWLTSRYYPAAETMVLASVMTFAVVLHTNGTEQKNSDTDEDSKDKSGNNENVTWLEVGKLIVMLHIIAVPAVTLPTLAGGVLGALIAINLGYPAFGLFAAFIYPAFDVLLGQTIGIGLALGGLRLGQIITGNYDNVDKSNSTSSDSLFSTIPKEIYLSFSNMQFPRGRMLKWRH